MIILNKIQKHLLNENNYDNQTIEIIYEYIIYNNIHIIHKQKNTCLFSLKDFFVSCYVVFVNYVHRRVVVEI